LDGNQGAGEEEDESNLFKQSEGGFRGKFRFEARGTIVSGEN
jgi:hypothetical protein